MPWNGVHYPIMAWNRDQTLQSAITYSVNWYFEEVNSRVGPRKMQFYLDRIGYGNQDLSGGVRDFWLDSSLAISPMEQVGLLIQFYRYQLPFAPKNIDCVKETIRISASNETTLSGKTGTGIINGRYGNGWFIGYVEKGENVYYFATHIQRDGEANGRKAYEITL